MVVSLVEHGGGKIKDDHDRNTDLLCNCQQCDDAFESVNRALSEVAAITYANRMHKATKESTTLEEFLQVQASDHECQTATQTVELPTSFLRTTRTVAWYDKHLWKEDCTSTSQSYYAPAYYIYPTI